MTIVLDSVLNKPELDFQARPPEFVLGSVELGSGFFVGQLTFIIDGVHFSEKEVPLLFMARNLRRAREWMLAKGTTREFVIASDDWPYVLSFAKHKNKVKVSPGYTVPASSLIWKVSDKEFDTYRTTATVSAEELAGAIKSFYRRLYKKCAKQYPAIKDNELFQRWLYEPYSEKQIRALRHRDNCLERELAQNSFRTKLAYEQRAPRRLGSKDDGSEPD